MAKNPPFDGKVLYRFTATEEERKHYGMVEEYIVVQSSQYLNKFLFYIREGDLWAEDDGFASATVARLLKERAALAEELAATKAELAKLRGVKS